MRLIYSFILIFVSYGITAQVINTEVVSPSLLEEMNAAPDIYYPVYFLLKDRVDVFALNTDFAQQRLNQQERLNILVNTLENKAKHTQTNLINQLKQSPDVIEKSIQAYWITNVIFVKAKRELITAWSNRDEIAAIGFNGKLALEAVEDVPYCATIEPNATEPGLVAINAPALWALGYTGYGQIAFSADTGVDPSHPAIANQYRGICTSDSEAWYQYSGSITTPNSCTDHGTHTLGTMIGLDRNTNDTIGVAFNAQWIGSANLCGNSGTASNIGALQWALNPDDDLTTTEDMPAVINNSWYDPTLINACENLYVSTLTTLEAAGIAVVFSAGNAGPDISTITSPKNINLDLVNSFAVGSLNANFPDLMIANSSSRGPSTCGGANSLLIKPEVSAPGVSVRSCIYNGEYGEKNGTSMAAPHVSGTILLLKEAFPELMGTDLKLALYHSATDLGELGEDNTYGMGIINALAAYNYLIDQGHVPVDPVVNTDLVAMRIITDQLECGNTAKVKLWIENAGQTEVNNFEVDYSLNQGQDGQGSFMMEELLLPGERKLIELPPIALSTGEYEIILDIKNPNGQADERILNNKLLGKLRVVNTEPVNAYLETQNATVCENSKSILKADAIDGAVIQWYNAEVDGDLIGIGESFLTDDLSTTTTFYASAYYSDSLGLPNKEDAIGNTVGANADGALIFDCFQTCQLKKMKIYPSAFGPLIIGLRTEQDDVLWNHQVIITSLEPMVIDVNKEIPIGKDLELKIISGAALSHSFGDLAYPYEIPGIISIKRANNGPNDYFYFYNLELSYEHVCQRIPLTVDVLEGEDMIEAAFEISQDTLVLSQTNEIFFTNNSQSATEWHWDFGDGTISNAENPVHSYNEAGQYVISLTAIQDGMCSDAILDTLWVIGNIVSTQTPTWANQFKIFPNPLKDYFYLDFSFEEAIEMEIQLVDVLGSVRMTIPKQVYKKDRFKIETEQLEAGVYFLNLKAKNYRSARRLLKF